MVSVKGKPNMTMQTLNTLTATQARDLAAEINLKCSDCFTDAKAIKQFGKWVIKIGGGRECCYGRTIETVDGAWDCIRVFGNS
jgi:hypothetical protein